MGSTTPYPTTAFGPAPPVCAVRLMSSMISPALSAGKCERTDATTPETNAEEKLVPLIGTKPRGSCQASTRPGPFGSSETICSPGAATLTQGPCRLNSAGCPEVVNAATLSTYGENHAGLAIV